MFYADLHVHSKYSRATSKDCDLEHLYFWARKKGIAIVGTGDFTHPAWMVELREKLVPAEPGLFRLRPELERAMEQRLVGVPPSQTRFMLSVEISNIYKRGDKTRKIHNLIYAPDFDSAARFAGRLARIGNIASDGRPILGLDSRDLLEIALESGPGCYLVPAHIWTPWFAVLGSRSGFDAVADCYADLASHVFAVETGLSSDPAMNWRLSQLDRYRLVSSSDAHSPPKLGREASAFTTELDYFALRQALETGDGFGGTVEFFPEEGKYHLDGHRKCNVCLEPGQAREHGGLCPVCGKPLTLGVLHRVEELADRAEGVPPAGAAPFSCLVPLPEVLGELFASGVTSQKVQAAYERVIAKLGPELHVLRHAPLEDIQKHGSSLLAEAITRMRAGRVVRKAGFDGEYGVIRMFEDGELDARRGPSLFGAAEPRTPPPAEEESVRAAASSLLEPLFARLHAEPEPSPPAEPVEIGGVRESEARAFESSILAALDSEQRAAAAVVAGPLLIVAGPGTGKTRTLTHRIAHLVREHGVAPEACLAITFTRRAADELRERLQALLGETAAAIDVLTFHALGAAILIAHAGRLGQPHALRPATDDQRSAALREMLDVSERKASALLAAISQSKRTRTPPAQGSELEQAWAAYERNLRAQGLCDFDDLLALSVQLLEADADIAAHYRARYLQISIDEYQDIDELQYRLVQLIAGSAGNLCAIGDPDQAIYGFRGADVGFFVNFSRDFPGATTVVLNRNYRSSENIVAAATQMMASASLVPDRKLEAQAGARCKLELHAAASDRAEADFVVARIEQLIGGYSFYSIDSGRVESGTGENHGFADFAVLARTARQLENLEPALLRAGIPFQRRAHTPLSEDPLVRALLLELERSPDDGEITTALAAASRRLAAADGNKDRLDAVLGMLMPAAVKAGGVRERFVAEVVLGTEIDAFDPRADRVSLLTLHAAKGLEFNSVLIVGCEDGLVPLTFGGRCDLAEERRLFFVGMTRARRRLVLSHARKRQLHGTLREQQPSPFLRDIEPDLLELTRLNAAARPKPKTQLDLF